MLELYFKCTGAVPFWFIDVISAYCHKSYYRVQSTISPEVIDCQAHNIYTGVYKNFISMYATKEQKNSPTHAHS